MSAYNFTQGRGEQEGKILANHLSEEWSKTQICIHMWSRELKYIRHFTHLRNQIL